MQKYFITKQSLLEILKELVSSGDEIITEQPEGIKFVKAANIEDHFPDNSKRPSNISAKEHFFPKTEPLFYYKSEQDGIKLKDVAIDKKRTIFFGLRPCDAAAIPTLSKVFNWDYKDEFFNGRVEKSVVIGMSCDYSDEHCFCTSTGLSQHETKGSDLFLTSLKNGSYLCEIISEKGKEFLESFKERFQTFENNSLIEPKEKKSATPLKKFDSKAVKEWIDKNFNDEIWQKAGELCLGCAQCAFVCPVCHCFDIVDVKLQHSCGARLKNWDACQFGLFTKHAGGHNPRSIQAARYRQRISHKFSYYKEKFDETLCTGCGRCSRGCPVGIDINEVATEIFNKSLAVEIC